jgi:hypothetical protein
VRSASTCASSSSCTAARSAISEILTTGLAAAFEALDIPLGVDLALSQGGIQLALLLGAHQPFSITESAAARLLQRSIPLACASICRKVSRQIPFAPYAQKAARRRPG